MRKTATPPEPEPLDEDPDAIGLDPDIGPLRRCLVTRVSKPRETMLRFVVGPEAEVVFDIAATLPGRGMWLSASGDVLELAIKRGVFARAAKSQVKLQPDLRKFIETRLSARVTELIGLARRSGAAISGFEKAREWLVNKRAGLIVQAADGSVEERARFVGGRDIPVVAVLDAAALGVIFARDHAVHVAVARGRLAGMIELEAMRLAGVAGAAPSGHTAKQS